jgi:hypothetical protein
VAVGHVPQAQAHAVLLGKLVSKTKKINDGTEKADKRREN